jgi:hypothetical protein
MTAILKSIMRDNSNSLEVRFSRQIQNYYKTGLNSKSL